MNKEEREILAKELKEQREKDMIVTYEDKQVFLNNYLNTLLELKQSFGYKFLDPRILKKVKFNDYMISLIEKDIKGEENEKTKKKNIK